MPQDRRETDVLLRRLITDVLGDPHPNFAKHFVDLGGDSLAALRLNARLSDALGLDIPLILPFEAASLTDLAARIDAIRASLDEDRSPESKLERTEEAAWK